MLPTAAHHAEALVAAILVAALIGYAWALLTPSRPPVDRPLALIALCADGRWVVHHGLTGRDSYPDLGLLLAALPDLSCRYRLILTRDASDTLARLPLTPTERKLLDLPCG